MELSLSLFGRPVELLTSWPVRGGGRVEHRQKQTAFMAGSTGGLGRLVGLWKWRCHSLARMTLEFDLMSEGECFGLCCSCNRLPRGLKRC